MVSDDLKQAKLCVNKGITVVPIPGPSALVAALSASGLSTDEFTFGRIVLEASFKKYFKQFNGTDTVFVQLAFFLNILVPERGD